jgi:hypothetical protein
VVEPSQASEEFAVRDDTSLESGHFTYFRKIEGKLSEDFGSEAEGPIEIPIPDCRFAGMGLLAIDKKDLSSRGRTLRTPIGVLLNTFFDDADYEMLVCVTSESVFHIMRMNSLYGIRTLETINANPLRGLHHMSPKRLGRRLSIRILTASKNMILGEEPSNEL